MKTARYAKRFGRRAKRVRRSRAPAPWTPATPSGLVLWVDSALGVTEAAGAVSAWADQSSAANHGTQAGPTEQPAYSATGWNGAYPAVTTDGSNDYMPFDGAGNDIAGDDTPYTIHWVGQFVSDLGAALQSAVCWGASANNFALIRLSRSGADAWDAFTRDDANTGSRNIATAASSADLNRHQHTLVFDGTTLTYYLDGASLGTSNTAQGTASLNRVTLGGMRRTGGLENPSNVRTVGLMVWTQALDGDSRAELWDYCRAHFGGLP